MQTPPTLDQLVELLMRCRPVVETLSGMQRDYESALDKALAEEGILSVPWAHFYERDITEHAAICAHILGIGDLLKGALSLSQSELHVLRLKMLSGEVDDEKIPDGVQRGHIAGATISMLRNMISKQAYGMYINELVAIVRETADPDCFLKAIRVDRSVLTCPTFAAVLSAAESLSDQEFMGAIGSALKEPRKTWNFNKGPLKLGFQILLESNALDTLTPESAYTILCERTGLYRGKDGEPPDPTSLWRLIQRWRSRLPTKARERMSS